MAVSLPGRILLEVTVLVTMVCTAAAAAPGGVYQQDFSAEFSLHSRGTLIGKTQWSLITSEGDRLVYVSESKAAGLAALISNEHILERSEWRRQTDGLRPHAYKYARSGRKEKKVVVSFDWTEGLARNTVRGETWSMPVPEGTLDKLGYVIAMMHDLDNGKRDLRYQIADGGKLKVYHLKTIGEEKLATPIGELATVVIRRVRDDAKRETTYWCAPRYRYLPVKVEHREKDGSVITLKIESVTGIPAI